MTDERDAMREALLTGRPVREALIEHHAQPAPEAAEPGTWCGASIRVSRDQPVPYIGPCVLRHGHDGPVHQDANGGQWADPRPATAEDAEALCPPTLHDRLAETLHCPTCGVEPGEHCLRARDDNLQPHMTRIQSADAVLPVVEAAIERAEQRYKGIAEGLAVEARDLVRQVGEAERERDEQRERADNAEDRLRKATDAYSHLHAQATATDVTRTRWRLRAEQAEVLLRDLVDPDDCYFDHHGGCQAHGYLSLQPGEQCPHAEAKALLAALAPQEEKP